MGVWVGNHGGEPMWRVSGLSGAAPAWNAVMRFLHESSPSRPPLAPPGLARLGQGRHTWPDAAAPASAPRAPTTRIRYPPDGAILAMDPDIPAGQQAVLLQAENADRTLRWLVDGNDVGGAADAPAWAPAPGRHELLLARPDGSGVDRARLVVRGAQAAAAEEPQSGSDAGGGQ